MNTATLRECGWLDPAAQQRTFRAVLDGYARPGRLVTLEGEAMLFWLAAMLDESVSLSDPACILHNSQRQMLLASLAPPAQADVLLLDGRQPPEGLSPRLGTLEAPERGATLLFKVASFDQSGPDSQIFNLQGPGIAGSRRVVVGGWHPAWLSERQRWVASFPLGVDCVLLAGQQMIALPRTTRIESIKD